MPEIKITIPDGDYCTECPMMEHYNTPLVNMFGDPTGNFREGYRCNRFRCDLEVERAECGWYERPKKTFWCTMSEEQRAMTALVMLASLKLQHGKQEEKQKQTGTGGDAK